MALISTLLGDWQKVEKLCLYFTPIFSSALLCKQLPQEGRDFLLANELFTELMKVARHEKRVMSLLNVDNFIEKLQMCAEKLEQVQKVRFIVHK